MRLYHITATMPTGEERIYTRFGKVRSKVFALNLRIKFPRARITMRPVPETERQPIVGGFCNGG